VAALAAASQDTWNLACRAVAERVAAALLAVPAGAVGAARARRGEVLHVHVKVVPRACACACICNVHLYLIDCVREVARVEWHEHVEQRGPIEAHLQVELVSKLNRLLRQLPGGVADRSALAREQVAAAAAPPRWRPCRDACGSQDHARPRAGHKPAAGEQNYGRKRHERGHSGHDSGDRAGLVVLTSFSSNCLKTCTASRAVQKGNHGHEYLFKLARLTRLRRDGAVEADLRVTMRASSSPSCATLDPRPRHGLEQRQQRTGLTRLPQRCAASWGCGAARSCARRRTSAGSTRASPRPTSCTWRCWARWARCCQRSSG
jgi:hypothetical protein